MDAFGEAYFRLVLEIDKHIDGYIDAYVGPPALKAEILAGEKKAPPALRDDLDQLHKLLPTNPPTRTAYLRAVLRALDCTVRMLEGERFEYLDEVNRLYDIAPQLVDEAIFEEGLNALDTLLPGSGPLNARMEAWRKPYQIEEPERLLPLIEMAQAETRRRTRERVDLVEGEALEVTLVKDQPWSAYNWYKGHARSLIEFNTDIPISALGLASLFAHEGYPGHHTEHQLKEKHLYQGKGYAEHAAMLLHSPAGVIAEGIAMHAVEMIFPDGTHHDWTAEVLVPEAGLPDIPAELLRQTAEAQRKLDHVGSNAAILYHTGKLDEAGAIDYYQTYGLSTEARARKRFSFMTHPLFRSYIFCYTEGYTLIENAAQGEARRALFERLLSGQMLPSQL